jgi:hypothetical protein
MTTDTQTPMREVDHRSSDGIDVRMLWSEDDGRVVISVSDARTGDSFEFEVREGDRAMDAFHHPYSYAAWRGVETSSPRDAVLAA